MTLDHNPGRRKRNAITTSPTQSTNHAREHTRTGKHYHPIRYLHLPPHWYHPGPRTQHDHPHRHHNQQDKCNPEPAPYLGHFEEEIWAFDFLFGGAPGDVAGEGVGEDGLEEVDAQSAKEEEARI